MGLRTRRGTWRGRASRGLRLGARRWLTSEWVRLSEVPSGGVAARGAGATEDACRAVRAGPRARRPSPPFRKVQRATREKQPSYAGGGRGGAGERAGGSGVVSRPRPPLDGFRTRGYGREIGTTRAPGRPRGGRARSSAAPRRSFHGKVVPPSPPGPRRRPRPRRLPAAHRSAGPVGRPLAGLARRDAVRVRGRVGRRLRGAGPVQALGRRAEGHPRGGGVAHLPPEA